jgi:biopolymer transport protein ExbD
MTSLKQIIEMKAQTEVRQDNQVFPQIRQIIERLIYNARIANIEVNDKELQIAIKGDAKEEYPAIRKVMDMCKIRKSIVLVTGLRGKDFLIKKNILQWLN